MPYKKTGVMRITASHLFLFRSNLSNHQGESHDRSIEGMLIISFCMKYIEHRIWSRHHYTNTSKRSFGGS